MIEDLLSDIIIVDNDIISEFHKYIQYNKSTGFLYCIHNEMFDYYGKNVFKLGMSKDTHYRLKQYVVSYVSNPEIKYKSGMVQYMPVTEKIVFDRSRNYRMSQNREFFQCDLQLIKQTMDHVCELLNSHDKYPNDKLIIAKIIKNIPSILILSIKKYPQIYYRFINQNKEKINTNFVCKNKLDIIVEKWKSKPNIFVFERYLNLVNYKKVYDNNTIENVIEFITLCENLYNIITNEIDIDNNATILNKLNSIKSNYHNEIIHILTEYYITEANIKHILCNYFCPDIDFKIDLDILSKWLNARKDSLKDTIVKSYIENTDYTMRKEVIKGKGGSPIDRIMLTNDAFKRLCMLSRSKKANMVRTCFISLEKLIDKYKDYIIKSMEKKIAQLEKNHHK